MAAYATISDLGKRYPRPLTQEEKTFCSTLLEDAAEYIDNVAKNAPESIKKIVSCRMVARAAEAGNLGAPIGASQGSQSAMSYTESWTMSGGGIGELYLTKADKQLLGLGNDIGARSPLEALANNTEVLL